MGVAHGVDVILFHQFDIFQHQFAADGTTQLRMFVAVRSFDQCRHTVHAEAAVFDFGGTEADSASRQFCLFAVTVFQREKKRVQVRMLCTPDFYTGDSYAFECDPVIVSGGNFDFLFQDGFAIGIFQLVGDACVGIRFACDPDIQVEDTVPIGLLVECRDNFVIGNVLLRSTVEVDVAFDTAQAPHVLTFQVGAGTPAVHFQRDGVFTRLQFIGDIPFCGRFGTLVVTEFFPVHPYIIERDDTFATEYHAAAVP